MSFVHLHVHMKYSLLDGLSEPRDAVKKVKDMGQTALAITDHGACFGLVAFYDECKKQGIKPILGVEAYCAPTDRRLREPVDGEKYYHLILLVKNEIGYKNLCKLVTKSNTEGFYYKPRIDFELLEKYHEGLICTSACVQGEVARKILKGKIEEAEAAVDKFRNLFGEDYYLEIQNHGLADERRAYDEIVRIARAKKIKLIATNDSHYVNSEDAEAHEWLLVLQQNKDKKGGNKITLKDPHMVYEGDYSLKSEEEMKLLFPALPDAIQNTQEVADKCNFEFHYGDYRMPKVHIPEEFGNDYFGYLKSEAYKGFEERYPKGVYPERIKAKKELDYELSVVEQMGFAEYFLDTRKTIMWARKHGILVGPGRGSAAGSTMCYCLYITDIDPIKYGLLFERFLNPERISMPDIDVDYDYAHKEEVVKSEAESNGYGNFAKIRTLMGMNAKSVLKDCCRINGLPTATGNELAAFIPDEPGATLQSAYDNSAELQDYLANADEIIRKIWKVALKLEGVPKSQSSHACGHIPTPVPCEDLFPSLVDKESGYLVCQYDMAEAEHLGNLKKDLLMLRNLTIIDVARKEVKKNKGIDVPLWTNEVLYDEKALETIARGETLGVFQLESDGMKAFMKQLKPDTFEDIIAGVALYRPGPMDFIPQYIEGKKNPKSIKYVTPQLQPILANTYGVIVYQEQVMQIVQQLAGYSKGRSDLVRKAMGKKKMDIMLAERKVFIDGNQAEIDEARANGKKEPPFVPGCVANGISAEIANDIYDQMVDFAKYAFNKSHAACYAVIAMMTAYLKAHYPLEFMAGLLSSVIDDSDKLAPYIAECRKLGVKIASPDVNKSSAVFTVDGNELRFGLACIKGITTEKMEEIGEERLAHGDFVSLADYIIRNPQAKKNNIESLIKAGAFDFTGHTRNAMLQSFESIINKIKKDSKEQCSGQMTIFDFCSNTSSADMYDIPEKPEMTAEEIREGEKEVTGLYLSSSPLDDHRVFIDQNTDSDSSNLEERTKYPVVFTAGLVTRKKLIHTKKTDALMAFYEIEDDYGKYTVVVFPKKYEELNCRNIGEGEVVWITGKPVDEDGKLEVLAEDMKIIKNIPVEYVLRCTPDKIGYVEGVLSALPQGGAHVTLYSTTPEGKTGVKYYCPVEESPKTTEVLTSAVGNCNIICRRLQQMSHSAVTGKNYR